MPYPSHAEYDLAVRYLGRFVSDSILKSGTPRSRNGIAVGQGGEPLCYPGGFAKVYVVDCGSKTYALRVWLHEISDAAKRYHATTQFLKKHPLPFFVEHFEFVANGIFVQGKRYPILRMEWVEGYSLRDFIVQSLHQPSLLRAAADAFAAMVTELHGKRVAHGDLQSENVLLRSNNGTVRYKLIDYDTLVVPALMGQPTASTGLASYQHPNRAASTTATEKDDYFSELVIYTCLCALAENPHLWAEFPANGRDKELLFEATDFCAPSPSALFQRLYRLGGKVEKLVVILWNFTRCPNIQLLLPLEKAIELSIQPTVATSGNAPTASSRSSFDSLLKQKLSERQAGSDGFPDSWLDDSPFHSRAKRRVSPEKGTKSVRAIPPPLPRQPGTVAQPPPTATSPSGSVTIVGSFQETVARMQKAPAPKSTPPIPAKSTSGYGVFVKWIAGLCALIWLLSKCDYSEPVPLRTASSQNGTPARGKLRAERQMSQSQAEEPKTPEPEVKPIEASTPKIPEQPTIEQQRAENRKRAEEQFKEGREYGQRDLFTKAASAYRNAVDIDPSYANAWLNLGWALDKLKNSADAISAFEMAVHLEPDLKGGWQNLAIEYASIRNAKAASVAIVQLRRLDRHESEVLTRKFDSDFVQGLAVAEYPSLGVLNSPLNREFAKRYHRYKASNPGYFDDNDWPIVLAQEAARAIGNQ